MIYVFCFYSASSGKQSNLAFSKEFKHCNIISYDGERWVYHEFDMCGFSLRHIGGVTSCLALSRGMRQISSLVSTITIEVCARAKHQWRPFIVRSCNEIDRYISGVDIGFTFNPKHLYNKLLKCDGSNYQILEHWRR